MKSLVVNVGSKGTANDRHEQRSTANVEDQIEHSNEDHKSTKIEDEATAFKEPSHLKTEEGIKYSALIETQAASSKCEFEPKKKNKRIISSALTRDQVVASKSNSQLKTEEDLRSSVEVQITASKYKSQSNTEEKSGSSFRIQDEVTMSKNESHSKINKKIKFFDQDRIAASNVKSKTEEKRKYPVHIRVNISKDKAQSKIEELKSFAQVRDKVTESKEVFQSNSKVNLEPPFRTQDREKRLNKKISSMNMLASLEAHNLQFVKSQDSKLRKQRNSKLLSMLEIYNSKLKSRFASPKSVSKESKYKIRSRERVLRTPESRYPSPKPRNSKNDVSSKVVKYKKEPLTMKANYSDARNTSRLINSYRFVNRQKRMEQDLMKKKNEIRKKENELMRLEMELLRQKIDLLKKKLKNSESGSPALESSNTAEHKVTNIGCTQNLSKPKSKRTWDQNYYENNEFPIVTKASVSKNARELTSKCILEKIDSIANSYWKKAKELKKAIEPTALVPFAFAGVNTDLASESTKIRKEDEKVKVTPLTNQVQKMKAYETRRQIWEVAGDLVEKIRQKKLRERKGKKSSFFSLGDE